MQRSLRVHKKSLKLLQRNSNSALAIQDHSWKRDILLANQAALESDTLGQSVSYRRAFFPLAAAGTA